MRGNLKLTTALCTALLCLGVFSTKAFDRCSIGSSHNAVAAAPQDISVTIAHTNATCYGTATGTATANATGVGPYAYLWSNGKTTATVNHLAAGSYSVTVTDSDGTTASASVVVNQPSNIVAYTNCIHTCPGACFGSANLTVSGGVPPYTFMWSTGATTQNIGGLCAGLYWVTITDAAGCVKVKGTVVSEVGTGVSITPSVIHPTCANPCGGSIVAVAGGMAPFMYAWSNGATTSSLTNLCGGTYSVTVTAGNGCTASATYVLATQSTITLTGSVTDATSCQQLCNGAIAVTATGGTAPYTILWSNGESGTMLMGLCPGVYTATVIDANGCSISNSGTVFEVGCETVQPCDFDLDVVTQDYLCTLILCAGTASVSINGGTAPYMYLWNTGATQTGLNLLCPGTYAVTVTDANGCTATGSGNVSCYLDPCESLSATAMASDATDCTGTCDGALVIAIGGGESPYTVDWSNGMAGGELMGLCPGVYGYIVTDGDGCTIAGEVEVGCEADCQFIVTFSSMPDSDCNDEVCDGSIMITAISGGTAPYNTMWSNGATTDNLEDVCAGIYSVTITDATGCMWESEFFNLDCVDEPDPCAGLYVTMFAFEDAQCDDEFCDGAVYAFVETDNLPVSYAWSNGATTIAFDNLCLGWYTVTVTDAAGCVVVDSIEVECIPAPDPCAYAVISLVATQDYLCEDDVCTGSIMMSSGGIFQPVSVVWSNGSTVGGISGLCAGWYSVTVTDAEGCQAIDSAEVTCYGDVDPCEDFSLTFVSVPDSDCSDTECDGSATVFAIGGTAPYAYFWDGGGTAASATGLCAGYSYFVVVTDASGCVMPIDVIVSCVDSCDISLESEVVNSTCFAACTGSITVTAAGGLEPYIYVWDNGSTGATLSGLCPGLYTVTVVGDGGCTATATYAVECITSPCEGFTVVALSGSDSNCDDKECDGWAQLIGADDYEVTWSNGSTATFLTGLCPGLYGYTVTDAAGCVLSGGVEIGCVASCILEVDIASQGALCGGNTASLFLADDNIFFPQYASYAWSNGSNETFIEVTEAGLYCVTVTDVTGCAGSACIELEEVGFEIAPLVLNPSCAGDCNGLIALEAEGGVDPYTFQWNTGEFSNMIMDLCPGEYCVTVIDDDQCVVEACFTLLDPEPLVITDLLMQADLCVGFPCSGSAIAFVEGGVGPYTYFWSSGHNTEFADQLCAGSYTLAVVDANFCFTEAEFDIFCLELVFFPNNEQFEALPSQEPVADAVIAANPNPFTAKTSLSFSVPEDVTASLEVYDMTGRLIDVLFRGDAKAHQTYTVEFSGYTGDGLYLYRLVTPTETRTGYLTQMK